MPRLHLPRSSYDFSVCELPNDFLDIVGDPDLRRMCLTQTGIVRFLALAFVESFSQNRMEIVEKSYEFYRRISAHFKWKLYGVRAMSVRRPYDSG